ncbi:hypothetical protein BC830DRAFT_1081995 [Chytriomyces sp. MP71]|nr:hypothetical protein BC830DRAFT_1081995 [Chytriomyces sp. MP71]
MFAEPSPLDYNAMLFLSNDFNLAPLPFFVPSSPPDAIPYFFHPLLELAHTPLLVGTPPSNISDGDAFIEPPLHAFSSTRNLDPLLQTPVLLYKQPQVASSDALDMVNLVYSIELQTWHPTIGSSPSSAVPATTPSPRPEHFPAKAITTSLEPHKSPRIESNAIDMNGNSPGCCSHVSNSCSHSRRTKLSQGQRDYMMSVFHEHNGRPDSKTLRVVAAEVNMPFRLVQYWMQNRRAALRLKRRRKSVHGIES